jgi:Na+-driven multidrug efflux pump
MRRVLINLGTWLGLSSTVTYVLFAKIFQLAALPVTVFLISTYFTAETQGFYYTFFSLIALQSFLELGLHTVVLNVVSYESMQIAVGTRGALTGDARARGRVLGLGRLIFRWYAIAGSLFLVLAGAGGAFFFASSTSAYEGWLLPWLVLVLVASLQFVVSPFNYLLEGLGQVGPIAQMRWLAVIANIATSWALIFGGANLWTGAGASAAVLIVNLWFLLTVFPGFFQQVARPAEIFINWKREIWPLQWRIGIQGAVNFFFYSLFNPVLFHYHGAAEAGRFGMTLQILGGVHAVSLAWLQAVVPQFGRLVAIRNFAQLDHVWRHATARVVVVSLIGNIAVLAAILVANRAMPDLAGRVLDSVPTALLAIAHWLLLPVLCIAAYTRGFKRESMTWISFASGICCGYLVWALGSRFGAIGAAGAFLAVTALLLLPGTILIWRRARREWPKELTSS